MDPKILAAALLWLRNHYDVRPVSDLRGKVLERVDRILKDCDPIAGADMKRMRELYPADED